MEENKWAHRRTSDASSVAHDGLSFSVSYKLAAIREALQTQKAEESPFPDDKDKEPILDARGHSASSFDVVNLTGAQVICVHSGHHDYPGVRICCSVFSEMPRASRQIYYEISPEARR